jgi:hypothetical protein
MPNVAAQCRQQKEKSPELFCAHPRCLWKVVKRDGTLSACQNHPGLGAGKPLPSPVQQET